MNTTSWEATQQMHTVATTGIDMKIVCQYLRQIIKNSLYIPKENDSGIGVGAWGRVGGA